LIFVISFLVFALIIAAMAVGVMAGRAPIKGSCGGIGALGIDQSLTFVGAIPNAAKLNRVLRMRQVRRYLTPTSADAEIDRSRHCQAAEFQ